MALIHVYFGGTKKRCGLLLMQESESEEDSDDDEAVQGTKRDGLEVFLVCVFFFVFSPAAFLSNALF